MKKMMLILVAAILAATLTFTAIAEQSALDAFNALTSGTAAESNGLQDPNAAYLRKIMDGAYDVATLDAETAAALALELPYLSAITAGDIAGYAAANQLTMARVRNAYYRALATVLHAEIITNPASEEQYRSAQTILALFLDPANTDTAVTERAAIRSSLTEASAQTIADNAGLTADFVQFLIMNENWDDDNWENDDDWKRTTPIAADSNLRVGDRDTATSTRIADMQRLLIEKGYLSGKADGIFGPRTEMALVEFQLANGLSGDGIYGNATAEKLTSANAVKRTDYVEDFYRGTPTTSTKTSTSSKTSTSKKNYRDTPDNTPDHTPDNTPDYRNTPDNTPDNSRDYDNSRD